MDITMQVLVATVIAFLVPATGWLIREIYYLRKPGGQAPHDVSTTLSNKKRRLEGVISGAKDASSKKMLLAQLDEVNHALLGLYGERLRLILEEAGLPVEEILITDSQSQLQSQVAARLKEIIEELNALPPFVSTRDLLFLGNAYYHMQRSEEAKNIYDKIFSLNPSSPAALANRGVLYWDMEKYDEALADFNRALGFKPDNPDILDNRGKLYAHMERYSETLADLSRSLELRPDEPDTLTNRGNTYHQLGRYDDALADYGRSMELRPDDPATLANRGITYAKMERYDEALADLNRSKGLEPDDVNTFYNLACLFSLWGKTDDALAYLKKAIGKAKEYREVARTDKDFDNIRDDPGFTKLLGSKPGGKG